MQNQAGLTQFARNSNGTIAQNTYGGEVSAMFNPGTGTFPYPNTGGYEVWCFCKESRVIGCETYRNWE